jgi:tetratricopeptide (TPR) repeat protein
MIATGVGAMLVAGGAIFVPGMLRSSATSKTPAAPIVHRPNPKTKKPGAEKPVAASATLTPEESAKSIAASLASGQSRMASGDLTAAIIAFHEVLTLDPNNEAAKAGIAEAGERYKASKAERDALEAIRIAYRDGEFTSGLRLAYRLPPTVSASRTEAIKLTGWYNLSVVDLKAGDCKSAMAHLDEALQLAPSDADAKKLKAFAAHCDGATKDRAYLDSVESLSFRPTPSS